MAYVPANPYGGPVTYPASEWAKLPSLLAQLGNPYAPHNPVHGQLRQVEANCGQTSWDVFPRLAPNNTNDKRPGPYRLELTGTVGTRAQGQVYQTALRIQLPMDYPARAPSVFLCPVPHKPGDKSRMCVSEAYYNRPSNPRVMRTSNELFLDCMLQWTADSDLVFLLLALQSAFEHSPPMLMVDFAQPAPTAAWPGAPGGAYPSATYPPYPGAGGAGPYPGAGGAGPQPPYQPYAYGQAQPQPQQPPHMPAQVPYQNPGQAAQPQAGGAAPEARLRAALADKLRAELQARYREVGERIDEAGRRGQEATAAVELLQRKLEGVAVMERKVAEAREGYERAAAEAEAFAARTSSAPAPASSLECISLGGSEWERLVALEAESTALLETADHLVELHKQRVIDTATLMVGIREARKRSFVAKELVARTNAQLDAQRSGGGARGAAAGGGSSAMEH